MSCMVPVNSTVASERAREALLRRREEKMALTPIKLVLPDKVGHEARWEVPKYYPRGKMYQRTILLACIHLSIHRLTLVQMTHGTRVETV